jgi:hypothetical protein
MPISPEDRKIIRDIAARVADIARHPAQQESECSKTGCSKPFSETLALSQNTPKRIAVFCYVLSTAGCPNTSTGRQVI